MPCDSCGADDAVVHLTEVVNNQARTVHLCAVCAEKRGLESSGTPAQALLAGMLADLGSKPGGLAAAMGSAGGMGALGSVAPCTFCGLTLAAFRKSGRLGCAQCWTSFEPQLRTLLQRVQGATQHVGKVYLSPDPSASERQKQLEVMRSKLQRAIDSEDFERAAELRDRIRALQSEPHSPPLDHPGEAS
jgi:protein arginine kinase activator